MDSAIKQLGGNRKLYFNLLEKFEEGSLSEALGKLTDAYDAQDTTLFRQGAHKLSSAAGYVGASLVQRCCKEIQKAHDNSEFSKMFDYYPLIIEASVEFQEVSRSIISEHKGKQPICYRV